MKKVELLPKMMSGEALLVVEYRFSQGEVIPWRDKETGRAVNLQLLSHHVEAGYRSIRVSERVPDGTDVTNYESPFKKGQQCALHLDGFSREKGNYSARGRLEALVE